MAFNQEETSFLVPINVPRGTPDDVKRDIFESVGEYLVQSILDYVGDGKSPVKGVGAFKKLSESYAEEEKSGDRLPNLDLNGDMLGSLTFEVTDRGVRVGIFDEDQAAKSYGHNTGFKGHPTLEGKAPKRQFLPTKSGETLKPEIIAGIRDIIQEMVDDGQDV